MVTKEQLDKNWYFTYVPTGKTWHKSGRLKTWKRTPERFQLPIKFGLYQHWYITELNVHDFILKEE